MKRPHPALTYGLYATRTLHGQAERALLGRHREALEALDALLLVHEYRVISTRRWSWEGQPTDDLGYDLCARRVDRPTAGAPLARIHDGTLTIAHGFKDTLPHRNVTAALLLFTRHMQLITGTPPEHTPRLTVVVTDGGHLSAKGA